MDRRFDMAEQRNQAAHAAICDAIGKVDRRLDDLYRHLLGAPAKTDLSGPAPRRRIAVGGPVVTRVAFIRVARPAWGAAGRGDRLEGMTTMDATILTVLGTGLTAIGTGVALFVAVWRVQGNRFDAVDRRFDMAEELNPRTLRHGGEAEPRTLRGDGPAVDRTVRHGGKREPRTLRDGRKREP